MTATTLVLRLLFTLVLFTMPLQLASAAECSTSQLVALRALDTNATEVCGASLLSPGAVTTICAKPECLAYVTSLNDQVPYCDIQGLNLRAIFAYANSFCAQRSANDDSVSFTRTPSSANTRFSSSSTAIVLAAVMSLLLATVSAAL